MIPALSVRALALFAALHATWSDIHPALDQLVQNDRDARDKGKPGAAGHAACARHVSTYTAGQLAASVATTRALGYRVPTGALLAGAALTAATHYAIDRRTLFGRLLRWHGWKTGYLDHATVQRRDGVVDAAGPGTAYTELDQAAHRLLGVAASLLTTWLAVRTETVAPY